MNLTLQRYHICIAVVKYLGRFFTRRGENFFRGGVWKFRGGGSANSWRVLY